MRLIAPQTYQKSLAIERLPSLFFDHLSFRGKTPVLLLEVGYIFSIAYFIQEKK